jgi:hypothetical protein
VRPEEKMATDSQNGDIIVLSASWWECVREGIICDTGSQFVSYSLSALTKCMRNNLKEEGFIVVHGSEVIVHG